MINVLFSAPEGRWAQYERPLTEALDDAGVAANLSTHHSPEDVDYVVYAPNGGLSDFTRFTRTKAVLSLWAGVESIVGNETLTMPLARMVDDGLTEGMVEWVTGHVLRHHLNIDLHLHGQDGVWRDWVPPLARDRKVGVLGLGALGSACAQALAALNFDVTGWSRTGKAVDGIACHHGPSGLDTVLARSEIVVLLLPRTPQTENILDAAAIARLPQGAVVVNPGRGALIDDDALLAALDASHLAHATLDVFRTEPLPKDHPFWAHPKVTVTPHIASETRPASAARVIAENIRRGEAGKPLLHLVDRDAGY
ncbi:2-hydroxyacid dehydrogenase [Tranquillimonas alkanivorans]|uniref:Glyoxylate/hydroxypyruvate reductase A n=1 Tax=Tranquillimonas alkanivorans TaxID=441119 RepID=A0A1I5MF13_9RHOB|nr:glyoxylate/hydroxypyruvate reductase A [Tranquillimonas alkanivorans]SFP08184.1 glyoxylate/hydroxypyruvate reductase A [Tranquillimonas alkanivorans]